MNFFVHKAFGGVLPLAALLWCVLFPGLKAEAQQFQAVTAKSALQFLESRYGAESAQWICEMRAVGGQPQPSQWEVITYNAQSPSLLHRFLVSPGFAQDGGPDNRRYSTDLPDGYFSGADIGVDSMAAFTIAEAEARKARIGFDSCDYFLKVREYSRETIWRLQLIDATHRMVGSVFVSGTSGEVLRTVWIQRPPTGLTQVMDSASPENMAYTGIAGDGDLRDRNPVIPPNTGLSVPPALPPLSSNNEPPAGDPLASPPPLIMPANPQEPSVTVTTPSAPGPSGSIFKQFPRDGGAAGTPQMPVTVPTIPIVPLEPNPPAANRPPIDIPSSGTGSIQRIPPPPVPGR